MTALYHQLPLFVTSKICTECHVEKLLDDFYLHKSGNSHNVCKTCNLAKQRADYVARHEKKIIDKRKRRGENVEHVRELERQSKQKPENREKRLAKQRAEFAEETNDPTRYEQRLIAQRARHHANKHRYRDRVLNYHHHHYAANIDKYHAYSKEWTRKNPLKNAERRRRRYARISKAKVDMVNYERILERDGYFCYICEKDIDSNATGDGKLNFEHNIPLIRGGAHSENNIKPSHRVCNYRKGTKLLSEMTPYQRRGL